MKRLLVGCVFALVAAFASAVLLTVPAAADSTEYVLVDLGAFDGGWGSGANAINERGQVVGSSEIGAYGSLAHAFLWDGDGLIDLGVLPGETRSSAEDINDRGQIVGNSGVDVFLWQNGEMSMIAAGGDAYAVNDRGQIAGKSGSSAVLWEHGEPTMLDMPTGGDVAQARAVNTQGNAVGFVDLGGPRHAVLWAGGEVVDLGTLGGNASIAWDINHRNQVVGDSSFTGYSPVHAFLWQNGELTALDTSAQQSGALGINERGQIVGYVGNDAVLWKNGEVTTLPTRGGRSIASDINNRGQIVGWSQRDFDYPPQWHAVLWQPSTG